MDQIHPSTFDSDHSYDSFPFYSIIQDNRPLPPQAPTQEEDDELFSEDPWVERPLRADYGTNIHLGSKAFLNFNSVFVDTCPVYIGARCLIGPNCCFYSGTHPLDPAVRNGTEGPELGKEIRIGDDCWLGGNVIVLPGITIGRGSTIGAGSVVTKVFWFIGASCTEGLGILICFTGCAALPCGCWQSGQDLEED